MPKTPQRKPTIFISHSSKDLLVARAARNMLEDRDHHALLLGLLSLENAPQHRIHEVIDAELKARDWFLLMDSQDARTSPWVQYEIKQAALLGKTLYRINVARFVKQDRYAVEGAIKPCIESFSRSIRAFLSYSRQDVRTVRQIDGFLRQSGFETFIDERNLQPGMEWAREIERAIRETLEQGVLMVFLSASSVASTWVMEELNYALALGGRVIPIMIERVNLPFALANLQYVDMTGGINPRVLLDLKSQLDNLRGKSMQCE